MEDGGRREAACALVAGALLWIIAGPTRAADLEGIKARGVLRVLVVASNAPDEFFSLLPKTEPGFDREILEGFASLNRVRLDPVPLTAWDALVPALREDKGDVIAGRFTVTDARRKLIDFTTEVFPTRNTVVSRKPQRVVKTLEELRAMRVGTVRGTSLAEAVAGAGVPPENVDDSIPSGGLPDALKQGKVAAVVLGIEDAVTSQRLDPQIQIGMFLGRPGSLAYGVRKEDAKLVAALSAYVDNLRRTPTWSRLVVKYFGEAGPDILRRARAE
jgi:ABC-type amino acid transport substrate-binding protein